MYRAATAMAVGVRRASCLNVSRCLGGQTRLLGFSNDAAGDGIMCATILARSIYTEGCKSVAAGMNAMGSRKGISMAVVSAVAYPKSRAQMISTSKETAKLLEEDPALEHYKSSKETVRKIRRFGDVLTIIVGAGCVYQIYDVTKKRREERLGQSKS